MSPGFVTFEVITEPMKWIVKRKYADFQWLRGALVSQFPGYYVTSIPGSTAT